MYLANHQQTPFWVAVNAGDLNIIRWLDNKGVVRKEDIMRPSKAYPSDI